MDDDLKYAIEVEGGMKAEDISNYSQVGCAAAITHHPRAVHNGLSPILVQSWVERTYGSKDHSMQILQGAQTQSQAAARCAWGLGRHRCARR